MHCTLFCFIESIFMTGWPLLRAGILKGHLFPCCTRCTSRVWLKCLHPTIGLGMLITAIPYGLLLVFLESYCLTTSSDLVCLKKCLLLIVVFHPSRDWNGIVGKDSLYVFFPSINHKWSGLCFLITISGLSWESRRSICIHTLRMS